MQKGKDYFYQKRVLRFWIEPQGEIVGEVRGSNYNLYLSALSMNDSLTELYETDCSCPIGRDCKHTAALLLAFLESLDNQQNSLSSGSTRLRALPGGAGGRNSSESSKETPLPMTISFLPDLVNTFRKVAQQRNSGSSQYSDDTPNSRSGSVLYVLRKQRYNFAPSIDIQSAALKKNGTLGTKRNISLDRLFSSSSYVSNEDFAIGRLWQSVSSFNPHYYGYGEDIPPDVEPVLFETLMAKILNSGRCYLEDEFDSPLKLGPRLKGDFRWEADQKQNWHLLPMAIQNDSTVPCLKWTIPWYVDTASGACGPVDFDMESSTYQILVRTRSLSLSEAKNLPVLLHQMDLLDVIPMPPCANQIEIQELTPETTLELDVLKAKQPITRDGSSVISTGQSLRTLVVSGANSSQVRPPRYDSQGKIVLERVDATIVNKQINRLLDLGFTEVQEDKFGKRSDGKRHFIAKNDLAWLKFDQESIEQLRSDGLSISTQIEHDLLPIEVTEESLEIETNSPGGWWFSMELHIKVDGKKVPLLPIMVSAIRALKDSDSMGDSIEILNRNGKYVFSVEDGTLVSVPFDRIRSVLQLVKDMVDKDMNVDKISVVDALDVIADETLAASRWIGFDRIRQFAERLKALTNIPAIEPPKNFLTELRPYQLDGLSWLQMIAKHEFGGILADDMGLGKTVQMLAHIATEKEQGRLDRPFIVVCPTSVLPNWLIETKKFAPHLNVVPFHGPTRFGSLSALKTADIVVTTYALLFRDIDALKQIEWHGVILDEAQYIKNHTTKLAKAARSLKARHRFCTTGTPVQNHLSELWSQFQFLMPGFLQDHATFKDIFRDPIEKLGLAAPKQILTKRIRPFMVRRTKKDVAAELPDKTVIMQHVELEGSQRDLYETVRLTATKQVLDEISKKGFKNSRIIVLDALLKLRQACCHPQLVKLPAAAKVTKSAKLEALTEMVQQLVQDGRKILIFSQFTSMLSKVAGKLDEAGLTYVELTGSTKDRATPIAQFQQGDVPIFLISLKAGGTGLNLTAADVVIHYDPWWNPAVEDQATDRAHRIGQTKNVFVYKMIAKGTIEERMIQLQDRKRLIADSIYDDEGNLGKSFTEQDLEYLLRPISDD